jgi:hypothetical protein
MDPLSRPASSGAPYPPVYPPPPERYGPPQRPEQTPEPTALVPHEPGGESRAPVQAQVLERTVIPYSLPPEEPRKQNRVWQGIKWPLRKALLGIYMLGEAIRKHKREAMVIGALLLALIVTGAVVYQVTRPAPPRVAVEQPNPPPLPASVLHYLHARQHFDAAEMWAAYNSTARSSLNTTEPKLQTALNQQKAAGLAITRYVYTGGYRSPDGTSHYTVEVYASEQGQSGVFTWYFQVGSDGLIQQRLDLTPQ